MKAAKCIHTVKNKIRLLYFLAISVIISLILASNISMLYFTGTVLNKIVISSILLTICGVVISIPIYMANNSLKKLTFNALKTSNILLDISATALFLILIYILFTIYNFLIIIPL